MAACRSRPPSAIPTTVCAKYATAVVEAAARSMRLDHRYRASAVETTSWYATALAWYLWYKGIERAAASTTAVAFFAQPVVGIALGGLLLNEAIGPALVAGGVVLAVGVGLVSTA